MTRPLILWGGSDSFMDPTRPVPRPEADLEYVTKASEHGVTRLIPGGKPSDDFISFAQQQGLEVHPYLAFNFNGGLVLYQWSLDYSTPPPHTKTAREIIDKHRPVWRSPNVVGINEYARNNPEQWSLDRSRSRELRPGWRVTMSLAYPEARRYLIGQYLEMMSNSGTTGVQVEFVDGNMDHDGVADSGYEDRMMSEFEQLSGRRPLDVPNNDPEWIQFRAGYVTTFLRELREAMKTLHSGSKLTTTMSARGRDGDMQVLLDWDTWTADGLVDELYLWFRSTNDLRTIEHLTHETVTTVGRRCPVIVELSCYHPGSIQRPDMLVEAARLALNNGAYAVGVYGSDAVEQLALWGAIESISQIKVGVS